MIKVYWTRSYPKHKDLQAMGLNPSSMMSGLRIPAPEPLLKHLDYQTFFGPLVSKCPAIVDDLKNVFVIKSPVDITIDIDIITKKMNITKQDLDFAKSFIGDPQGKWGIHQLGIGYLFFAEKSLQATQLPAYYDENDFTKGTHTISSSFDIGNWFRVAGKPAFMIKPGTKSIDIKEGDPLIYYKFNTTEKIKLIEFDDQELQRLEEKSPEWLCSTLKDHTDKVITLERCYAYFNQFKMRQRILKLIKRNLI
jgi:hypothetical protein